jgi:6-phosphogluconolactonase
VPAAGAVGLDTTLWLLDEDAAAKLPSRTAEQS